MLMLSPASGPEDWAALHSGRLIHSLDRDAPAAISVYEAVMQHLDEDDPLRADYLYWLGRAWFEAGDPLQASTALNAVDRRATVSGAAASLEGRIQLDGVRLPTIPASIDLLADPPHLVPGWGARATPYAIVPPTDGQPAAISWPIATDNVRAGFLALGLAHGAGSLEAVRFEANSSGVALAARVVVESIDGHTYAGVPTVVRPGQWTPVQVRTRQLRPQTQGEPGLDPARVNMVAIEVAPLDPGAVSSSAHFQLRSLNLDGPH
jgi:hypothetical protein